MLLAKTKILCPNYGAWPGDPLSYFSRNSNNQYDDWVCAKILREVFDFPPWSKIQLFAHDTPSTHRVRVKLIEDSGETLSGHKHSSYLVNLPEFFDHTIEFDSALERRIQRLLKQGHKVVYVECEYEEIKTPQ